VVLVLINQEPIQPHRVVSVQLVTIQQLALLVVVVVVLAQVQWPVLLVVPLVQLVLIMRQVAHSLFAHFVILDIIVPEVQIKLLVQPDIIEAQLAEVVLVVVQFVPVVLTVQLVHLVVALVQPALTVQLVHQVVQLVQLEPITALPVNQLVLLVPLIIIVQVVVVELLVQVVILRHQAQLPPELVLR
jgi:hypothetical protein